MPAGLLYLKSEPRMGVSVCGGGRRVQEEQSSLNFSLFSPDTLRDTPPKVACDQTQGLNHSQAPQSPALKLQTFQLHPFFPLGPELHGVVLPETHSWFLTLRTRSNNSGTGNSQLFPQLIIDVKI